MNWMLRTALGASSVAILAIASFACAPNGDKQQDGTSGKHQTDSADCTLWESGEIICGALETAHPYTHDALFTTIKAPEGTASITLTFSDFSTIEGEDELVVADVDGKEIDRLSGDLGSFSRTYDSEKLELTFEPRSVIARIFKGRFGFAISDMEFTPIVDNATPDGGLDECVCTDLYEPVCGANNTTFTNSCEAQCVGAEVMHEGACEQKPDISSCFCLQIYAPVCGINGVTYGNSCEADCVGISIESMGTCTPQGPSNL